MSTLTSSRIAATAMLAIAVAAPAAAKSDTAEVRCAGVNTCKGEGKCKEYSYPKAASETPSAGNGCKGQNACKGLGWLHVPTAQECVAQGGKVLAD